MLSFLGAAGISLAFAFALTGCGHRSAGALQVRSLDQNPVQMTVRFATAVFSSDPVNGSSFMLSDVPSRRVLEGDVATGQLLHVELLWLPKPGRTPLDASATNASFRYIVITDGAVGVYGGAGFALPSEDPASAHMVSMNVREASLRLLEATPGFVDLLSPGALSGTFTARRDDAEARKLNLAASQLVTNALGKTRFVDAGRGRSAFSP